MDLNAILRKTYISTADPAEYYFASKHIGSWEEWDTASRDPEKGPIIEEWRRELAAKLRSEALARILEAAQGETRDALAANKYIYEALDRDDKKNKVGRPTLELIAREAKKLVEDNKVREEAYDRIFKQ